MLLECKIRLRSPMLGEVKSTGGVRRFNRVDNGDIAIPSIAWTNTILKCASDSGKKLPREILMLPDGFAPPTIVLHYRTYSRTKKEMFECIRKGTVITFDCILREDLDVKCTMEEFKTYLDMAGKFYGFSEWGSKFGFGRFSIESITQIKH